DFNVVGWQSSYTGQPLPAEEMRIWVEETVAHLRALQPTRVLEIGCGTGLLLTRLAAACDRYVGLDFSAAVLGQLAAYPATRKDLRHVELRQGLAHDLAFLADDSVDLVLLNSVVQYFPDLDYLLDVLTQAVRVTRHGGHIFVGDVRSLPLLEAYHTSVELSKASPELALGELRQRINQAQSHDKELVIDPALFGELARRWAKVGRADVALKAGAYDNELSRFRYDVTLKLGEKETVEAPARWLAWDAAGRWREDLAEALAQEPEAAVGLRGLRDRRVAPAVTAVRLLHTPDHALAAAGQLHTACAEVGGEDPDAVIQLARRLGAALCWQGFDAAGVYAVVFNPRRGALAGLPEAPRSAYRRYANAPIRLEGEVALGRALQDYLRQSLPDYMVPATILVLDAWPLTPNGKLDRRALPVPERPTESYRAPRAPAEVLLCELVAEVLALPRVRLDDNFFALGGDSILSILLVSRARRVGLELTPRDIFAQPTLAALAAVVRASDTASRAECEAGTRAGELSPTPIIRWLFARGGPIRRFNQSMLLRVPGDLVEAHLVTALQAVLDTHDALRLRLEPNAAGEAPAIHILPRGAVTAADCLTRLDLSGMDEAPRLERLQAEARAAGGRLDPAAGRVLQALWFRWAGEGRLLLVIHHLA